MRISRAGLPCRPCGAICSRFRPAHRPVVPGHGRRTRGHAGDRRVPAARLRPRERVTGRQEAPGEARTRRWRLIGTDARERGGLRDLPAASRRLAPAGHAVAGRPEAPEGPRSPADRRPGGAGVQRRAARRHRPPPECGRRPRAATWMAYGWPAPAATPPCAAVLLRRAQPERSRADRGPARCRPANGAHLPAAGRQSGLGRTRR